MKSITYPTIRDNRDLRNAYELLNTALADGLSQELIQATKRAIRAYNKRTYCENHTTVADSGDSVTVLVRLPENITNMEAAEAYFESYEKREYIPSQYDCTSQTFTAWYKLFQRQGKWYAYHLICMDV